MILKYNLNNLINNIRINKKYLIIPYSKLTYFIFLLLKNYCIKNIYKLNNWILIYILNNNKKFKFFNLKDKKNNITYIQLKKIQKQNKNGIIFTSKGVFLISEALILKQGGILFCLIY